MNDQTFDPRLGAGAPGSPLDAAMKRGDWELAALYLVAGFLEAARRLPLGALEEALDLLSADDIPRRRVRRVRGRRRHGPG